MSLFNFRATEIHKWMAEDGFEAPKIGCKCAEAFVLLHAYIKHLRENQKKEKK